ncbi:hypothetical protein [Pseudomonas piscis]|nr:hypothetical protein [Pseudomonas piscis]
MDFVTAVSHKFNKQNYFSFTRLIKCATAALAIRAAPLNQAVDMTGK